jgi:hypothetical protein
MAAHFLQEGPHNINLVLCDFSDTSITMIRYCKT